MAERIRILHLEDDPLDGELVRMTIQSAFPEASLARVETREAYMAALARDVPDVILADYRVPGFDGLEALGIAQARAADTPFMFVSGALGEERAVETLKLGAVDYILKDALGSLPRAVGNAIARAAERRERAQAEQALAAHRQLLHALIDSIPDMIYAVDAQLRLTVLNRAAADFLGIRAAEFIGTSLMQLNRVNDLVADVAEDREILRSGRGFAGELRHATLGSGQHLWFEVTKTSLVSPESGEIVGLVCVCRDVTRRKSLERELAETSHREQRKLGAEIHDGLGQELAGLSMMLKGLEQRLVATQAPAVPQAQRIREVAQRAVSTARSIARGLAPVELERDGLAAALQALAHRSSEALDMDVDIETEDLPEDIDENWATHFFRIAQEAIANAARHGGAAHVLLRLYAIDGELVLEVRDDGRGFDVSSVEASGMGLSLMRYRATTMGGDLAIVSDPEQGTFVRASCPLFRSSRTL